MSRLDRKKSERTVTQREMAESIASALALASRPARTGELPPLRIQKMREVMQAVVAPLMDLVDDENAMMTGEECVFMLLAGALFVQTAAVMKSDVPLKTEITAQIWGKKR
jgi:hypothetical protein